MQTAAELSYHTDLEGHEKQGQWASFQVFPYSHIDKSPVVCLPREPERSHAGRNRSNFYEAFQASHVTKAKGDSIFTHPVLLKMYLPSFFSNVLDNLIPDGTICQNLSASFSVFTSR